MAEVAPPAGGGGANRTFLLIIGGLAALLFLGLLALGALFVLPGLLGGASTPVAAATTTPTRIAIAPTATRNPVTNTPVVVATATSLLPPTSTEEPLPTDTETPEPPVTPIEVTATPLPNGGASANGGTGSLPNTGLGEDLLTLGGGLFLLFVIVVVRRARTAS